MWQRHNLQAAYSSPLLIDVDGQALDVSTVR
jgi:hypothetical protein